MTSARSSFSASVVVALLVALFALVAGPAAAAAGDSATDPGKLFIKAEGDLLTQYDMAQVRITTSFFVGRGMKFASDCFRSRNMY